MHKSLNPMPMTGLDRHRFPAALSVGLIVTPRAFAEPPTELIGQRPAQAEQDRASGEPGRQARVEHYARGFAPDVPHDLRPASQSVVGLAYGIAFAAVVGPSVAQ